MRSLVLLWLAGCAAPPAWSPPAGCPVHAAEGAAVTAPSTRNLVLIAVDGVRWHEVFEGVDPTRSDEVLPAAQLLPNIYRRLVAGGVALGARGAPISASGPEFVSLPGYQELLGGRPSRCGSNHCAPIAWPTLLDVARQEGGEVAAIGSWERLERAVALDDRTLPVSTGRHHGPTRDQVRVDDCASAILDDAARAAPDPGHLDYRPDRYTAPLALEFLVARRPRVLFVGLGDTDEWGHAHDYAAHLEALRAVDRFVGALFDALDGLGRYGAETTVMLTTDHGWADDFSDHGSFAPESSRVWLLAAGGSIAARGLVAAAAPHHLADVAPTARALLGLPPDGDARAGRPIAELLP